MIFQLIKKELIKDQQGIREIGYETEEAREIKGVGCFVRHTVRITRLDNGQPFIHVAVTFVPNSSIVETGKGVDGKPLHDVVKDKTEFVPDKEVKKYGKN